MDSFIGDDPTLPVDLDGSSNPDHLQEVTFGSHLEYPDGSIPVLHKASSGRMSPIRAKTMKEYDKQIAELKKENFSLKLRIYFLEERMQQKFGSDGEEVYKTNIELKVEVESLKKELMDKQELLMKASNALESLESEHYIEIQKMRETAKRQIETEKESLESKIKQFEENPNSDVLQEKCSAIDQLNKALHEKDDQIEKLELERRSFPDIRRPLELKIKELEKDIISKLKTIENYEAMLQSEKENKNQTKISLCTLQRELEDAERKNEDAERNLEDAKIELESRAKSIEDLEDKIKIFENESVKYDEKALKKNKAIQGLVKSIKTKDIEIENLQSQLEKASCEIEKLNDRFHRYGENQQEKDKDTSLLEREDLEEYENKLKEKELENENLKQSLNKKDKELQNLKMEKGVIEESFHKSQKKLEKTLEDLRDQLSKEQQKTEDRLGESEQHYQKLIESHERQLKNKEKIIQCLTDNLREKDRTLEEYVNTFQKENRTTESETKEKIINRLKEKLKEREKYHEELIDEKLKLIDEKDSELKRLVKDVREKNRDLENALQTIQSLEAKIRLLELEANQKESNIKQSDVSLKSAQKQLQDLNANHNRIIEEKDSIIARLQNALSNTEKKLKDIADQECNDSSQELKLTSLLERLKEKEKLLAELIAERNSAAVENNNMVQKLLSNINDTEKTIKDIHEQHNKEIVAKNKEIQKLITDLNRKELQFQSMESRGTYSEKEHQSFLEKMKSALEEKDKTIEALVESGRNKDILFRQMLLNNPSNIDAVELHTLKGEVLELKNQLQNKENIIEELTLELKLLKQNGKSNIINVHLNDRDSEKSDATLENLHQTLKEVIAVLQQKLQMPKESPSNVNMLRLGCTLSEVVNACQALSDMVAAERQISLPDGNNSIDNDMQQLYHQLLQNIESTFNIKQKMENMPKDQPSESSDHDVKTKQAHHLIPTHISSSDALLTYSSTLSKTESIGESGEVILTLQKHLGNFMKHLNEMNEPVSLPLKEGDDESVITKNRWTLFSLRLSEEYSKLQELVILVQQYLEMFKNDVKTDKDWDITLQGDPNKNEDVESIWDDSEVNTLKEEIEYLKQDNSNLKKQLQESRMSSITLETRRRQVVKTHIVSEEEMDGSSEKSQVDISERESSEILQNQILTNFDKSSNENSSEHYVSELTLDKLKSLEVSNDKNCTVLRRESSKKIKSKSSSSSETEEIQVPSKFCNINELEVSVKCRNKNSNSKPFASTFIIDSCNSGKELLNSQLTHPNFEVSEIQNDKKLKRSVNFIVESDHSTLENSLDCEDFRSVLYDRENEISALKQQLYLQSEKHEAECSELKQKLKALESLSEEKHMPAPLMKTRLSNSNKNEFKENPIPDNLIKENAVCKSVKESDNLIKENAVCKSVKESEFPNKKPLIKNDKYIDDLIQELDRLRLQLIEKERQNNSLKHHIEEILGDSADPNILQRYDELKKSLEEKERDNDYLRLELLKVLELENNCKTPFHLERGQLAKGLSDKVKELQTIVSRTKASNETFVIKSESHMNDLDSFDSEKNSAEKLLSEEKNSMSSNPNLRLHKFISGSLQDLREIKSCPCNAGSLRNSDIKETYNSDKVGFSMTDVVTELQKQVEKFRSLWQQSESMNIILKQQMELNSKSNMEDSINPHLLVEMTREIEHLKNELSEANKIIKEKEKRLCNTLSKEHQKQFSNDSLSKNDQHASQSPPQRYSLNDNHFPIGSGLISHRSQSETNIFAIGQKHFFRSTDNVDHIDKSLTEDFIYLKPHNLRVENKSNDAEKLHKQVTELQQQARVNQLVIDSLSLNSDPDLSFVLPTKLDKCHRDENSYSENKVKGLSLVDQTFQENLSTTAALHSNKEIAFLKKKLFNFQSLCDSLHLHLEELFVFLEYLLHFDENGHLDINILTPQKIASLKRFLSQSRELSYSLSESLHSTIDENILHDQTLQENNYSNQQSIMEDRKSPKGMESPTTLYQEISQLKKELHERQQVNLKQKELLNEKQQIATIRRQEVDRLVKQLEDKNKLVIKYQQKVRALQLQLRQLSGKAALINYARLERQSVSDNPDTDAESQKSLEMKTNSNSHSRQNRSIEPCDGSYDYTTRKPPLKPVHATSIYGSRENYLQTGDMLEDYDLLEKNNQQLSDPIATTSQSNSRATSEGKSSNLEDQSKVPLLDKKINLCDYVRRKEMRSPSSQRSDIGHYLDSGISSQRSRVSPKSPPSVDEHIITNKSERFLSGKVHEISGQHSHSKKSLLQDLNQVLCNKNTSYGKQESLSESDQWSAPDRSESLRRLGLDLKVSMMEKSIPQGQSSESAATSEIKSGWGKISSNQSYSRKKRGFNSEIIDIRRLEAKVEDLEQVNLSLRTELDLLRNFQNSSVAAQTSNVHGRLSADILEAHLNEIRTLRIRLEESIHNNDQLRERLEQKLANSDWDNIKKQSVMEPGNNIIYGGSNQSHEVDLLRKQLEERDRINKERQDAITQILQDHTIQQEENDLLKESRNHLETINNQLTMDHNNLQATIKKLEENKKCYDSTKAHMELSIHQLEKGNQLLMQDNQQLQASNITLQKNNYQLETTNQTLEETNKMLEQTNKVLEENNQKLQLANNSMEKINFNVQKAYQSLEETHKQLQKSFMVQEGQKENMVKENKMLQEGVNRLQKEIGHLQKENRRSQEDTDHMKKQLKENIDLINNLKKELNVYEKLHTTLTDIVNGGATDSTTNTRDLSSLILEIRNLLHHIEENIELSTDLRKKIDERFDAMEKSSGGAITHIHHHHHSSAPINSAATQTATEPKIKSQLIEDLHQKLSELYDKEKHSKPENRLKEKAVCPLTHVGYKSKKDHVLCNTYPLSAANEVINKSPRRHSLQTSDDINILEHQHSFIPHSLRRSASSDRLNESRLRSHNDHSMNIYHSAKDIANFGNIGDLEINQRNKASQHIRQVFQGLNDEQQSRKKLSEENSGSGHCNLSDLQIETDMKKLFHKSKKSYLTSTNAEDLQTFVKGKSASDDKVMSNISSSKGFWSKLDTQSWEGFQNNPTLHSSLLSHDKPTFKSSLSSNSHPRDTLRLDDLRTDIPFDPANQSCSGTGYNINDPYPPLSPPIVRVDSDNRLLCAVGRIDDYELLKKEIGESLVILKGMEARLRDKLFSYKHGSPVKSVEHSTLKELGSSTSNLQLCLNESFRLIRLFWTTMLPPKKEAKDHNLDKNLLEENELLKNEAEVLQKRIASMEKVLHKAVGKLEATNRMREGMERAIVKQLSKTHNVLKRARGNLQDNSKKVMEPTKVPKKGT